MKDAEGETHQVTPVIRKLVPERELNQFDGTRGVLTFDHTLRIEPVERNERRMSKMVVLPRPFSA